MKSSSLIGTNPMYLGNNLYKIRDNLHVKENLIISYETVVGRIENDRVVKFGKFSRTTGKHIGKIANMLSLPVVECTEGRTIYYDKFCYGVKINFSGSISPKSTSIIFDRISSGYSYALAIASLSKDIRKKDWELLDKNVLSNNLIKGALILNRFKLF